MSLSKTVAWDVQNGGSDANGGGFDTAALNAVPTAGVDRSQTTSPFVAFDGVTKTAATLATSATVTLTGVTGSQQDVGNIVNITGGSGFLTGRYQIVNTTSTTWTLDRNCTSGAGAGMTGSMGGCLATIGAAIAAQNASAINEQSIYVKLGTYQITTALTNPSTAAGGGYQNRTMGYQTTHGDNPTGANRPTIAVGTGAGIVCWNVSTGNGFMLENFILEGAASSGTKGTQGIVLVNAALNFTTIYNVTIQNFSAEAVSCAGSAAPALIRVEVTGCAGTNGAVNSANTGLVLICCYIHDNTKTGVYHPGTYLTVVDCIFANNTGAASDGLNVVSNYATQIRGSVFYGNGRDGVRYSQTFGQLASSLRNNIFAKNVGYGVNFPTAPTYQSIPMFDYNAYWSNGTGATHNLTNGPHDVLLSNDPFTNDTGTPPDFTLNATVSAGASLRAAGDPGVISGLTGSTGYRDIGAFQHADPAAAGMLFTPNLDGV